MKPRRRHVQSPCGGFGEPGSFDVAIHNYRSWALIAPDAAASCEQRDVEVDVGDGAARTDQPTIFCS